jgi:hypothetical protein
VSDRAGVGGNRDVRAAAAAAAYEEEEEEQGTLLSTIHKKLFFS